MSDANEAAKLDREAYITGRALDAAHAVGFREGAAHMQKEQAARIERLEAALREHACGCVDRCFEDREKYGEYTKFENAICSGARARAALEAK